MRLLTLLLMLAITVTAQAAPLNVVSAAPPANGITTIYTPISIRFDLAVNPATVNASTFRVYGRWSGPVTGASTFSADERTLTFRPDRAFFAGETVYVNLSTAIRARDDSPLRTGGYAFSFNTATQPATRSFTEIDAFTNRTSSDVVTRLYGAAGADMNRDGWPDLTTVNEVSADLRVYLNRADGTGLFADNFLGPFPVGVQASPNEPADFDNDGNIDMAVAAATSNVASIALGNGDGTFAAAQNVAVGARPKGLAILDVDGDADLDLVTANATGNNLSLMLNDGNGVFGAATSFDSGGTAEYGLAAGDMNEDGIVDLVVGTRDSGDIRVLVGTGTGTFTLRSTRSASGPVWMLAIGDLNGDGHLDVTSANGYGSNGVVFLGDGTGAFSSATSYTIGTLIIGTELGDLDGDGDLDWILSASGSAAWKIYTNNGAGSFTFDQQFFASSQASCSVALDIDNDLDLDLVLIDEEHDIILLKRNQGAAAPPPGAVPASQVGLLEPLRIARGAGGSLDLTWAPSCSSTDTDYAIYWGPIGAYDDPEFVACTTQRRTWASITAPAGDAYFLVVPLSAGVEGSYGTDSAGAERPAGSPACHAKALEAACP